MKRALAFSMWIGLGVMAGCGAKVVVDEPSGQGGTGGTGGAGGVISNGSTGGGGPTTVTVSVGPGPVTVSAVSVGPGPNVATTVGPGPNVATSVGSGTTLCDGVGDCNSCLMCAAGGPCAELWDKCQSFAPCSGLMTCLNNCAGDPACADECAQTFAEGLDTYNALAICMVCDSCFSDCDGAASGCP